MYNIPITVLERIQKEISNLLTELENCIHWSDKYLKAESQKYTSYELKKARRKLKNIKKAILLRPSAALFGESQVGKSYLIKTFLSDNKGQFDITASDGNKVSFLEEINPKGGGVESTSVVCRFSTKVSSPDNSFPLVGKLLSVKEIVLMLCDTYFNDVKNHTNLPTAGKIEEKIESLNDMFGTSSFRQNVLEEDDIYDIQEYLEQHFGSFVSSLLKSEYWEVLGGLIHKIDYKNWYLAFDIIFGENEHIQHIFDRLIRELRELDFADEVYLEFNAVLRKHGTILNVARLRELNDGPQYEDVVNEKDFDENVHLKWYVNGNLNRGRKINKSTLCALIAEIAFKVDSQKEQDVEFLVYSDLLDFPGAQPRLENNENDVQDKHISEMVLRGKVGYLFNKYSSQYLISNLLLCHHNRDLKAKSIANLLSTWIQTFIGETPEERAAFLKNAPVPPLFKVFTYFNVDLAFDAINDKDPSTYPTKWSKRFHTIFEKQIVNSASNNWHEKWTPNVPFQNNYLLRDFYWSKDIFTGFEETGKELEYVSVTVDSYYDQVKSSFLNSSLVNKYFNNPDKSWNEAALKNKDGSKWILENLTKVSTNHAKTLKFIRDLDAIAKQVVQEITKHFHSDDADQQIITANKNADELRFHLDTIFGANPSTFGHFVKTFTIKEADVYDFYRKELNSIDRSKHKNFNEYVAIRNRCGKFYQEKEDYQKNLQILVDTYSYISSTTEAEKVFEGKGIMLNYLFYGDDSVNIKNNSQMLSEGVLELWFKRFTEERFQFILEKGIKASALHNLFDNIKQSVKKHNIGETIAFEIRDYVDRIDNVDEIIFMVADISAGIINKYFNSMGWAYYGDNEKSNIQKTDKENGLKLDFSRLENTLDYRDNDDISSLFDQMKDYNEEVSKTVPNKDVINRYPNFWNFNRWSELMKISFVANCDIPTYDIAANQALGGLIDIMEQYEFKEEELNNANVQ